VVPGWVSSSTRRLKIVAACPAAVSRTTTVTRGRHATRAHRLLVPMLSRRHQPGKTGGALDSGIANCGRVPCPGDDIRLSRFLLLVELCRRSTGPSPITTRADTTAWCTAAFRLRSSRHADSAHQPGDNSARTAARPTGPRHRNRARGAAHAGAGVADARRGIRRCARRRPAGADIVPRRDRGRTTVLWPGLRSLRPAPSAALRADAVSRRHGALRVRLVVAGADRRPHARGAWRLRRNGTGPSDRARRLRPRALGERTGDDHDGDEPGTLAVTRNRRLSRPMGSGGAPISSCSARSGRLS
jgi:hypothetical protein